MASCGDPAGSGRSRVGEEYATPAGADRAPLTSRAHTARDEPNGGLVATGRPAIAAPTGSRPKFTNQKGKPYGRA
ncbi:hypothetical protein ABH935_004282 [Catenulispora sp. GAS73]